ncbi:conserved hypothetical protein [Candidatus Phytoplasma mali]|uniref:Uncharacterized protein n=1 Tax=Phytoplasma mali (strain AT) TaxID=482235 RepID=B3R0N3_PHYMT|nr:hypothetical protein [Candidatus Phytoplasma mali]CAP18617.1 conserved hypothetical protein [Candidatus Phytoplasma mali]
MRNSKKNNNDDEILNDEMYLFWQNEQYLIQQQMIEYHLDNTRKINLSVQYDYISQKIKNYQQRKVNNKTTKTKNNDQPESSSQHKNLSKKK